MSIIAPWLRAALVSTTLLAGLTLAPADARAATPACEPTAYFPEDVSLDIDSRPSCVELRVQEGECTCAPTIVVQNDCDQPLTAQGFEFLCGCSSCESVPAGEEGTISLSVAGKKEGDVVHAKFEAAAGDQALIVNVTYTVGFEAKEAKTEDGGCTAARSAPEGRGWLIAVAGALALAARRARRK
jgi:hypothetical protein